MLRGAPKARNGNGTAADTCVHVRSMFGLPSRYAGGPSDWIGQQEGLTPFPNRPRGCALRSHSDSSRLTSKERGNLGLVAQFVGHIHDGICGFPQVCST